jgi:hypothetical protein
MQLEGRCYCGELRYEVTGDPVIKGQCHCRECQYVSGGGPNLIFGFPDSGFEYTTGQPASFSRSDLDSPIAREFCANCGTHILSRVPAIPGVVILKVGTLDNPKQFPGPDMAIYMCDAQPFHVVPEGVKAFDRIPG